MNEQNMNSSFEQQSMLLNKATAKFNQARSSLLIIAILTLINIILLISNSSRYFLFSASLPYFAVSLCMLLCGKYPAEIYEGELESILQNPLPSAVFIASLVFSLVVIAAFVVCFFWGKAKKAGYITGFVLIMLDSLFFLLTIIIGFSSLDSIFDILVRLFLIVEQIIGLKSMYEIEKLKATMPILIETEYCDRSESDNSSKKRLSE